MKCKNCGKEDLTINNRKKYCSEECKKIYKENHPKIYNYTCSYCGKSFQSKNKRKTDKAYCSSNCCVKHKIEINKIKNQAICEKCGITFTKQRKEQRFCSVDCVNQWQKTRTGINSSHFNFSISLEERKIICKNCNKIFYVIPSEINKRKFCSKKCCHDWCMKNIFSTDNFKNIAKERILLMIKNNKFPKVNSIPQQKIVELLKNNNIEFEIEKIFGEFAVDIWLKQYNLCIEVMGDFWHCNPNKFSIIKYLNQKNRIGRDKAKNTYIAKNLSIPILYLWEEDIQKDLKKCEELIKLFINKKGNLDNYESFNYSLKLNQLKLNNKIIKPYREYSIKKLSNIIKLINVHTNND